MTDITALLLKAFYSEGANKKLYSKAPLTNSPLAACEHCCHGMGRNEAGHAKHREAVQCLASANAF